MGREPDLGGKKIEKNEKETVGNRNERKQSREREEREGIRWCVKR